jgi:hypothetical protein
MVRREERLQNSGSSIAFILLLARVNPSAECIERANAFLQGGMDWKTLYRTSLLHGVAPLIYRNLSLLKDVPADMTQRLKASYLRNAADVIRTSCELGEISEALGMGGVESMAIKGIVTADELYGDAALYPSSDIDLMIRRADAPRAVEIMKEMGYRPEYGPDPFVLEQYGGVNFFREGVKGVELHTVLGEKRYFAVPEDFWWEDSRKRRYERHIYNVLSREKMLLFSSIHLFGHGYAPLKFIVAMAEMLRAYEKDIRWEALLEDARRFNARRSLLLSLYLASTLLDAPLPGSVADMLSRRCKKERWISGKIEERVFKEKSNFAFVMFLLTLLQYNIRQVACRMGRWLLPSLKEVAYRYNLPPGSKRVFLYYVFNPLLLLLWRRSV